MTIKRINNFAIFIAFQIKGVGDRLFGLEQLMAHVKHLVKTQGDLAASLVANQNRASSLQDHEVVPDLCVSHQRQLDHLLRNHMQLLGKGGFGVAAIS